jgi:hypothetical protein
MKGRRGGMAKRSVEKIIERALADADFRQRLLADPKAACAEYDLSGEELEKVVASSKEVFSGKLEPRVSKKRLGAKFAGFSGPLGIDGVQE